MNRLEAMQIFARVVELASFTRAAASLGSAKASVSVAVQQLEGLLGTRLLHRTTRRVELTQDGRVFYERCKDLLADVDELQSMFQQDQQGLRGRLRVDMLGRVARDLVIPRLPEWLAAHPQLEIELSSSDRRVDLVREGFDCVLRSGALEESSLIARPLGRLRMVNAASPAYLQAHGRPRRLQDLARHRLVHYVNVLGVKPEGWEYHDGTAWRSFGMGGVLTVNSVDAYEAACLAGLGLIQSPLLGLKPLLDAGRLVEVLPRYRAAPMPMYLVYAHRRNLPRRVRVFMDWLAGILAPHLDPM